MTIRMTVRGMSCGHCVSAVRSVLEAVPGVTSVVDVGLDPGQAVVEGTPDPAALIKAVEAEGYDAAIA